MAGPPVVAVEHETRPDAENAKVPQTWFRMYNEVVDDPKVQRLPPAVFKNWVNFMCIASKHGGVLPEFKDIAYRLRVTTVRVER